MIIANRKTKYNLNLNAYLRSILSGRYAIIF